MQIIEINPDNQHKYTDFLAKCEIGNIHQMPQWGEFQSKMPSRGKYWIIYTQNDSGAIQSSALLVRQNLPFKLCWLYSPRGPIFDDKNKESLENLTPLFEKIAHIASKENAVFYRFDPALTQKSFNNNRNLNHILKKLKSKPAHAHYQPESTLIIDLTPPEEEILKQMKPKGRYNIKVANKHSVRVRISNLKASPKSTPDPSDDHSPDLQAFYDLLKQTATRDNFHGHGIDYYQNMLTELGPEKVRLVVAEYSPRKSTSTPIFSKSEYSAYDQQIDGSLHSPKILAAAIVTYFKDTATYYFGASSNEHRNVMAPYKLHWQIMQDAKKQGYKYYDMFGIAPALHKEIEKHPLNGFLKKLSDKDSQVAIPDFDPAHPWAKVTDFKLKFGGRRVDYMDAREIIYKPFWYRLMKIAKYLKGQKLP